MAKFILIQPKPVDISISNPGPTGNPFTDWTPPQGNFGSSSGIGTPSGPPSFVPPPNISAPSFPSSGTPQPMIDTSHIPVQSSSTLSRSSGDFSNQHLDSDTVTDISLSDGCYDLVSFHNNTIGYKGIDQLLFNQSRMSLHPEKGSIYQGMLARPGMNIVKLDLSHCSIGSLGSVAIGEAIYSDSTLRFLQHLNLSNNNIDDSGIYAFGNAWFCKTSPCLRSLDLSNNLLTDNGAQSLSWSFKNGNFYYLNKLDISGNKSITDIGKKDIVSGMNSGLSAGDTFVILEKQSSLESVKSFMKKAFTYYAREIKKYLDNQQITNEEVSKAALKVYGTDDWAHCKKFLAEGVGAVGLGVTSKVSHSMLMKVVPHPYAKAAVFGGLVIEASVESMGSVDWKDAGYCIAAINGSVSDYIFPKEEDVGFVGENGVIDESF